MTVLTRSEEGAKALAAIRRTGLENNSPVLDVVVRKPQPYRLAALTASPCYQGMEYTDDKSALRDWFPLVMEGRQPDDVVAATRMRTGSDVDYGALTSILLDSLRRMDGFSIRFLQRVQDLRRAGALWNVRVRDEMTGETTDSRAINSVSGTAEEWNCRLNLELEGF